MNESRNCSHFSALPTPYSCITVHRNFCGTAAPMTYTPSGPILSSKPWLQAMESWRLCTFGSWIRHPKSDTLMTFRRQSHVFCRAAFFLWKERQVPQPTFQQLAHIICHLGSGGTVFKGGSSKMLNDQVTSISSLPNHLNYEPPKAQGLLLQLLLCSIGRHRWCRWRHRRFGPFALFHLPVLAIRCRRLSWRTHCWDFLGTTATTTTTTTTIHDPPSSF